MSGGTLETKISRFLLTYRTTPHTTTGTTPAELLMKRRLRTNLDRMKPATSTTVYNSQEDQKFFHDRTAQMRSFSKEQAVFAQNFGQGPMWLAGHIEDNISPLSFLIKLEDGRIVRRHQDQIRSRPCTTITTQPQVEDNLDHEEVELSMPSNAAPLEVTRESSPDSEQPATAVTSALPRQTGRTIKPPNRFSPD